LQIMIREAAFDEKVLTLRNNSNTIELSSDRVVVLSFNDTKAAYIRPLTEVIALVEERVTKQKIQALLELSAEKLISAVKKGESAESLAGASGYEFESHEGIKRDDFSISSEFLNLAFETPRPQKGQVEFTSNNQIDGGYVVLGVSSFKEGALEDFEDTERSIVSRQFSSQISNLESAYYENSVFASANVKVY